MPWQVQPSKAAWCWQPWQQRTPTLPAQPPWLLSCFSIATARWVLYQRHLSCHYCPQYYSSLLGLLSHCYC